MKSFEDIDKIMQTIPEAWRNRWCGGENGACACMGCVQIGNRVIMWEESNSGSFSLDPEYIDESKIPQELYDKYKITKDEWLFWKDKFKENRVSPIN